MKHDFLKHWRVVRYLIKKQYGLSQQDLELLLFLYSEGRFTKDDFDWYSTIVSWDIRRFIKLKKEEIGREKFPESKRNPIYNPKRSSEKKYLNAMKKINREETT